jgi:hypothetical protein
MLFGRRNALLSSLKLFKFKALGKITEVCRQPNFNAAKRGWQPNGSGIQHRSPTREFFERIHFRNRYFGIVLLHACSLLARLESVLRRAPRSVDKPTNMPLSLYC